jgi:hypothetical protein
MSPNPRRGANRVGASMSIRLLACPSMASCSAPWTLRTLEPVDQAPSREIAFVEALHLDYIDNGAKWENSDLPSFLEAAGAWCRDSDGFHANAGVDRSPMPPWRLFAEILMAARAYE